MQVTTKYVPASKVFDSATGVNLGEVHNAIEVNLNSAEQLAYAKAINKAVSKRKLSKGDLHVLDKVDELTMRLFGMCLKDSMVTKARIKACNKHGLKFNDRDGLVAHMHMYYENAMCLQAKYKVDTKLAYLLIDRLGENVMQEFVSTTRRILQNEDLTLDDLRLLASVERVFNADLNATMLSEGVNVAVYNACKMHGVVFTELLTSKLH